MGVPGFFKWVSTRYRKQILYNDRKIICDNFYTDTNCALHPECFAIVEIHENVTDKNKLENLMIIRIKEYLTYLETYVSPRKMMFIAIDGVAPMAKIEQQKPRRIKAVHDSELINKIKKKYGKKINDVWSNVAITPGTEFMEKLHIELNSFYKSKQRKGFKYIYSSYHTPGEGEHKIKNHIKQNVNKNETCVIYGLDADLIFLSLAVNIPNIYLLRESDQFEQKKSVQSKKNIEKKMTYVSIDGLRDAYNKELKHLIFQYEKIRVNDDLINDFIVICFLLGNDFLPHLPTIHVNRNGLNEIINAYIITFGIFKNKLVTMKNGKTSLNSSFFLNMIEILKNREEHFYRYTLPESKEKLSRRKCLETDKCSIEIWELENLKFIEKERNTIMDIEDIKYEYYSNAFGITQSYEKYARKISDEYLNGIIWTMNYYFNDCKDWLWHYKYQYAPFLSDIYNFGNFEILDDKNIIDNESESISILTQLTIVIPRKYSGLLPKKYAKLITSKESDIIDYYPEKIKLDYYEKDFLWQCIPKLPILNIKRIINTINRIEKKYEINRNKNLENFVY